MQRRPVESESKILNLRFDIIKQSLDLTPAWLFSPFLGFGLKILNPIIQIG